MTVRVLASGEEDQHRLRFEVEDTGIGIAPETMAELFSNFRQGDDAATRKFGGIGIGLTLSRRLAKLMGGDVGGSSEVGRGSLFWVEVPAPLATQRLNLKKRRRLREFGSSWWMITRPTGWWR